MQRKSSMILNETRCGQFVLLIKKPLAFDRKENELNFV